MSWTTQYVIFRLAEDKTFTQVHSEDDLKKAKYWLGYIGKPGDVLCRTPLHPKHSRQSDQPEYWSHKTSKGVVSDERLWRMNLSKDGIEAVFPGATTA
ncbi:MAG: hypothetical protein QY326_05245 [Bdellovibrionota bacterium]|nr:MAG: hypothetical protein QY326_05245 [Bdellovibrionota bacterium]